MKNASLFVGMLVLCAASCADRDRSNPLDPENPDTNGKPAALRVLSSRDTVRLSWNRLDLSDLIGYKIQRRASFQDDFETIAQVDKTRGSFRDIVREFNTEYSYRYSAVGETYESDPSPEVMIEPGPTFNWVADLSSRRLIKLTHDGRYRLFATAGFGGMRDITPNPLTGEVWIVDIPSVNAGRLVRVNADGQVIQPLITLRAPTDLSLDRSTGAFWVSDSLSNLVSKFNASGARLFDVGNFSNPVLVSVDQRNGRCWMADDELREIVRVEADGSGRLVASAQVGRDICCMRVDSRDGSVWVAESSRIIKLDENGEQLLQIDTPLTNVQDIEVNDNTGEVWVINWTPSRILKYSASGELLFQLGDDFSDPEDLSLSTFDNSCLVADTDNRRLVRISALGNIVREIDVVPVPGMLAVENTQVREEQQ